MNFKANNKVISNLRGVILTINLYIGSIFIFSMICFKPKVPISLFPVLNFDEFRLYYSSIDYKGLSVNAFFYASFLLVAGLKEWGAYYEMRALVSLRIFDMLTIGLVQSFLSQGWWCVLQVNIYRSLLMIFNCFYFLWFYDKSKNSCLSDLQMEIIRATDWNPCLTKCFTKYLIHGQKNSLLEFFNTNIRNNYDVWRFIQNPEGIDSN
jgi:hypothetical protein